MQHTEMDISNIDYGGKAFLFFYNSEEMFLKMFKSSAPMRFCIKEVFMALVKLGVYPPLKKIKTQPMWQDVVAEEKQLFSSVNNFEICCMAVLVLNHFAEQRLKQTSGI